MSLDDAVNAFNNAHYSENTGSVKAQNTQEKGQPKQDDNKTTLNWKFTPDDYVPRKEIDDTHGEAQTQAQTEAQPQPAQDKTQHRYSFRSFSELCKQPKAVPYLIDGYLIANGLELIYGESGCGKSFSVMDMAASVACPDVETWHGQKIKHGGVVYFAGEGSAGLNARLACWAQERGVNTEDINLAICDEVFSLDDPNDKEHSIERTIEEIKMFENPALVIFDTLNVYMNGEENSNSDIGHFMRICRKIRDDCGVSVLIVHHASPKTQTKGEARGATALKAAMDVQLKLAKSIDILTLTVEKNKDAKPAKELIFTLVEHEIKDWKDDNGNPVTSCVIELAEKLMNFRAEKAEQEKAERKKPKLTKKQLFSRDTYKEAAKKYGFIVCDNEATKHEKILVEREHWREVYYDLTPGDNKDSKRAGFNNSVNEMCRDNKMVAIERNEGKEFYSLDLSGDADPSYKIEIREGIKERERRGGGKQESR